MKLINVELKGLNFNIGGQDHQADEKGIIELEDKEAAKVLCETAGFKLIRSGKPGLDVEPPKDIAPIVPEDGDELTEEELADLEAEAELGKLPESEVTEEEIPEPEIKPEAKPEPKPTGKWLPGKNNKQK